MKVLHVMSCRGWSSDAYWAARMTVELERAGHQVTLACRRGTEDRVISRARAAGVTRLETLTLAGGVDPAGDAADVRRLRQWLGRIDVVHTHRGKEHWLAALANRLTGDPRPLVRTRHIVQPVRAHALNRWLYGRATALVVTVTEAIRRQFLAGELAQPERVVALPGGVDATAWRPDLDGRALRASLGLPDDVPLIGLLGGFRVMKGHAVALAAAAELARRGRHFHLALVGRGALDLIIRTQRTRLGLADRVSIVDGVVDAASTVAGFDMALYVPLESDGMSRVLFECLAAGRPLVASRVGVVPEVLTDGEHALLVPAGEATALADAIERLLTDRALGARLAAAGRDLVERRCSGARVAEALAARYGALASAAAPA